MKKIIGIVFILAVVVCGALILPKNEEYDYLRLHIRANSNTAVDQNVKYKIKDLTVNYLTPYLCNVKTKKEAENIVKQHAQILTKQCGYFLKIKKKFY